MSAHAIGNDEQGRFDDERVLVLLAYATDVGAASEQNGHVALGVLARAV